MKIAKIECLNEIKDLYVDSVDVVVKTQCGHSYVVVVATPADLVDQMNQEKVNFIPPCSPIIIVKKLTEEIIKQAIETHAEEYDGHYLKLCHFGDEINTSVFDKLEQEHREEWEGWEEEED